MKELLIASLAPLSRSISIVNSSTYELVMIIKRGVFRDGLVRKLLENFLR